MSSKIRSRIGHVGRRSEPSLLHKLLIKRFALVGALAPFAVSPGNFRIATGRQREDGSADRQDVGRHRRVQGARPLRGLVVPRRSDKAHVDAVMIGRVREIAIVCQLPLRLGAAKTHRHDRYARVIRRDTDGVLEVRHLRAAIDDDDARRRRDGVRPFDIDRFFVLPVARGVGRRGRRKLVDNEIDGRKIELGVEDVDVALNIGIVVLIDDRNRLPGPVAGAVTR